nr:excinuclease ABC subunit UvrC [Chloroflexia bacterium]
TIDDDPREIVSGFVSQFYADAAIVPQRLMLQHPLPDAEAALIADWLAERRGGKVEIGVPQRGANRGLVEMVAKSADENLEQSRLKFLSDEMKMTGAMSELATALDLPRLPRRIECYDISNLQGTNPVASMVVFEDGKPAKKEYRRFTIKTITGANDFAMMNEVITRRFRRAGDAVADAAADAVAGAPAEAGADPASDAVANGSGDKEGKWTKLPDLVIVDGGKGQLGAALEGLNEVGMVVPICGLAKEQEEIFLPGRSDSIMLPRDSQALFLVQRVRDEAHRFAVTFHRSRRSKAAFHSRLDDVPGIGPTRKKALIRTFGSVRGVKNATVDELTAVNGITPALAEQIKSVL